MWAGIGPASRTEEYGEADRMSGHACSLYADVHESSDRHHNRYQLRQHPR